MTDQNLITSLRQKATPEENALLDKYLPKIKTVFDCKKWLDVYDLYHSGELLPDEYSLFGGENWSYNLPTSRPVQRTFN